MGKEANCSSLRVLQVTAALNEGGVERGTVEMANFIVAQGAASFVASSGGQLVSQLEFAGTRHYCLPLAQRTPWSILYCALRLAKIIRQERISLVHARSRAPAWAALFACRMTGCTMLTTFHGTHKIQNRLKRLYNSVMVRGELVIAISNFLRQHIIDNYSVSAEKVQVAQRGFDPQVFNPERFTAEDRQETRHNLGLPSDTPIIALPGRLTRLKGHTDLLRALAEIRDLPWDAILIGGAGKKRAYAQELHRLASELKIADRVHFLGGQSDIARYYAISDLIVSPSTVPEAFGRVAIEAQAMGKPVIASAHGGALETIRPGETGWLYPPGDYRQLAERLRHALSSVVSLAAVGAAGRKWVADRFTLEQMCQAEWSVYRQLEEQLGG